jgi:hypothetical protein
MNLETPVQRDKRGRRMTIQAGLGSGDLEYLKDIEAKLEGHDLRTFRSLYGSKQCRGQAGIRPAVDMALREMRARAVARLPGTRTWRSC